jgi:predicted AAA+ superfamily ATPase
MTEKIQQLFTITGARGTGKSTLAATYAIRDAVGIDAIHEALEHTVYFDSESSANNLRRGFRETGVGDFGKYVNLQDRFSDLPADGDLLDRINKVIHRGCRRDSKAR